jgi:hypothetical protein
MDKKSIDSSVYLKVFIDFLFFIFKYKIYCKQIIIQLNLIPLENKCHLLNKNYTFATYLKL